MVSSNPIPPSVEFEEELERVAAMRWASEHAHSGYVDGDQPGLFHLVPALPSGGAVPAPASGRARLKVPNVAQLEVADQWGKKAVEVSITFLKLFTVTIGGSTLLAASVFTVLWFGLHPSQLGRFLLSAIGGGAITGGGVFLRRARAAKLLVQDPQVTDSVG